MKKQLFAALPGACAAVAARAFAPVHVLPCLLAGLVVLFVLLARALPPRESVTADFSDLFIFDSPLALTAAVLGAFALFAAAALNMLAGGIAAVTLLRSAFIFLCGAAGLYVVLSLRRGTDFSPAALLVPVCCLLVDLIFVYRENSRNPALEEFYPAILASAALCLAFLLLAAFAFRNGAPRNFSAVASAGLVFSAVTVCDSVFAHSLSTAAAQLGFFFLLLAFMACADFGE